MSSKTVVNGIVAVVAAAAGYAIYTGVFAPREGRVIAHDDLKQPPAQATTESEAGQAIPEVLPEFALTDRDGTTRSIRSWTGKSMVVNFWATWCAPCRKEIPLLKEMQKTHGDAGFQIVGVAVDDRTEVLKYATEIGIDYPVLVAEDPADGMSAVTSFGMGSIGFPFTVFTDNQHRIVVTHLGEITRPEFDVLSTAVTRVNRGELTPAAARVMAAKQLDAIKSSSSTGEVT